MAAAASTASTARVALVTGSNKGIGLQLVKDLAKGDARLTVLLCSRDAKRGEEAVKGLALPNVKALALDVDTEKSVETAAAEVKAKYGGVDILINNAGIAWKGDAFDETVARGTIGTNYYGVKRVQTHFFPLLRDHARVVNISSVMGARTLLNLQKGSKPAWAEQFLAPNLTVAQLDALMEQFTSDVKSNTWQAQGWPKSTYGISKVGCSMLTRITARDYKGPAKDVLINCCCPGWVRTDMAGPKAELTVEEGAETPVFLATLPAGTKETGLFWRKKKVDPWVYVPEADA